MDRFNPHIPPKSHFFLGSFAPESGREQIHLFAQVVAKKTLGEFFVASSDGVQKRAFRAGDVEEELGIVLRQSRRGLFEVGDERRGEDLQHAVAAGFEQKQMEFAVPAVRFLGVAGVVLDVADRFVELAEKRGRHAADRKRNDVHFNQETRFDELADVEVRDVHLHLDLRGEILGPERVDGHAALRGAVDDAHLAQHREGLSHLVARNAEAFGEFVFRVDASPFLRLGQNVLVNFAKEGFVIHGASPKGPESWGIVAGLQGTAKQSRSTRLSGGLHVSFST